MPKRINNIIDTNDKLIHQKLFDFLTPAEREALLSNANKVTLKKNQILTHEGDPPTSFYILLSGEISVTKHAKKKKNEHVLAYLHPGDIIGEMALIEKTPRGFTLKAIKSATTLLEFNVDSIKKTPEIYNKLGMHLGERAAERLRYLSEVHR